MKKILLLELILCFIFQGCFLSKWATKGDEVIQTVDVKIEEIRSSYIDIKDMYVKKVELYKQFKKAIYGTNGNTELWRYLEKNEPMMIIDIKRIDKELITIHNHLVYIDKKFGDKYITWQDYKKTVSSVTNQMRKLDIILEGVNTIAKSKLGKI